MPRSFRSARRHAWPVFGLSLAWLISAAQAQAQTLPTGGTVRAGAASIESAGAGSLSVTQTSERAIIDWRSFSIGQGGAVDFHNGSGATLNRVTGAFGSAINGLLSATGSVYLVNPNGVVIGREGRVKVGGGFVASTLEIPADDFLKGGDLTAAGNSTAAIVNYGKVGALGGDVVLTAARVENHGEIAAPAGAAGLLAGFEVMLRDRALEGGKFAVKIGDATTSVANDGSIRAAQAELRANGGDVFALAGNGAGVIDARGVSTADGRIYLVAEGGGGALTVQGALTARAAGDAAGFIETSGGRVALGEARIDAGKGGTWSLDPSQIEIDQTAANSIQGSLNDQTSVTQATTSGGSGDIIVDPGVHLGWGSNATLMLSAWRNINIGAGASISGGPTGTLVLKAGSSGDGIGSLSFGAGAAASAHTVDIYYNPASNPPPNGYGLQPVNTTSYATPDSFASFVTRTAGHDYMLVNTAIDLVNVKNNLGGAYALSKTINDDGVLPPIGSSSAPFTGVFNGQGFGFAGFRVGYSTTDLSGLFAMNTGTITNISGINLSVQGHDVVGALVGWNYGVISNIATTGGYPAVVGNNYVGGLVGVNYGRVQNISTSIAVNGANYVGGVIGANAASGLVTDVTTLSGSTVQGGGWYAGGVVGQNLGLPADGGALYNLSSATRVVGTNGVGDLVGDNEGRLWNSSASSLSAGANYVGGAVGVNTANGDVENVSYSGVVSASAQTGYYYAGGLVGANSGLVRDSAVTNAAAITGSQAVGGAVGVNYGTVKSLTVSPYSVQGLNYVGGVVGWNDQAGQVNNNSFTGKVTGASAQYYTGGIVGLNGGAIVGSTMQGQVTGGYGVGGVAGMNSGTISASTVSPLPNAPNSAVITGTGYVGGSAGYNFGAITNASATITVNGRDYIGGLVGWNGLGSTITGGEVFGYVTSTPPSGAFGYYAGGFAGLNTGAISGGVSNAAVTSGVGVGGLVGINYGQISAATATGAVTGQYFQVGGAVGVNQSGTVSGVTASGAVGGAYERIGGFVGENWASISGAHATGSVTGAASGNTQGGVGGFVGQNQGGSTIDGSDASGAVASGVHHAGGFAGINYGTITGSHASGAVDNTQGGLGAGGFAGLTTGIITGSYATGSVQGANSLGGFAGENDNVIRNSWSSGAVYGGAQAGGFAGVNRGGEITGAYATGPVSGTDRIGGFVGYAGGYIANAWTSSAVNGAGPRVGGFVGELESGQIASVLAYGPVSDPGYALAGVAGKNTGGTITNAYWDVAAANTYTGVTSGATGSATPVNGPYGSPYAASTYPNLDLQNSWTIREGVSRPILRFSPSQ